MQAARALVLQHLRLRASRPGAGGGGAVLVVRAGDERAGSGSESAVRARVVELVRRFDKIDADKVGSCLCCLLC